MKICVLVSSYEGVSSPFEAVGDEYQNPALYVNSHSFTLKVVTKAEAIPVIKSLVEGGEYDFIWNFMWGMGSFDSVAGLEATKYLESTGHPMLGTSSKYLSMGKLDLKMAAGGNTKDLQLPRWTTADNLNLSGMNYPLIVKPACNIGSVLMTANSVAKNKEELAQEIELIKSKTNDTILIEEYIQGAEVSCMVLETLDGVIGLHPLVYDFPQDWEETEKFLDFEKKFEGIDNGQITYKLYDGPEEILKKIQKASVAAYHVLGVFGSAYARVDLRVKGSEVYVLEVNHTPALFSKIGNTYGDDFVIQETFPGGHAALVEAIIASKRRFYYFKSFYGGFAPTYNNLLDTPQLIPQYPIWRNIVAKNDFSGEVLDLGCGTGIIGQLILECYPSSEMTGVDITAEMTKQATHYKDIILELMENAVDGFPEGSFDHITALGCLHFIVPSNFLVVVGRCFQIARKSITLTIERMSPTYKNNVLKINSSLYTVFDHVETIQEFQPPKDWNLVWTRDDDLWVSPTTKDMISGVTVRYERKPAQTA